MIGSETPAHINVLEWVHHKTKTIHIAIIQVYSYQDFVL